MGEMSLGREEMAELVQKVLYGVAQALRAMHSETPDILTVFTGATAGLTQALSGLEEVMLNGGGLKVLLSRSAGRMYGDVVEKRLMVWPNAEAMAEDHWFAQVQSCGGVIVPMLSVASLSRVCSLAPDSLCSNIILQALFMGKPVVAAMDGAAPGSPDRRTLGLDEGTPALQQALARKLVTFSDFGGHLAWSRDLGGVARKIFLPGSGPAQPVPRKAVPPAETFVGVPAMGPVRLVDTGVVKQARKTGQVIETLPNAIITPLAREQASGWGIQIRTAGPGGEV